MKPAFVLAFAAVCALTACTQGPDEIVSDDDSVRPFPPTPEKHQLVNALVDSFDAPACLGAELRYFGPRIDTRGKNVVREFAAPVACIYQLTARAKALDFSEVSQDTYTGALSSGSEDRIKIEIAEGENVGAVSWEISVI